MIKDVTFLKGRPVTYVRNETAGHQETIGPVFLPDHLSGQPHVELLWRYYHTGVRHDSRSRVYLYHMQASGFGETRKMTVIQ